MCMETTLCQNETTTEPLRILENKEENVKGDSMNAISNLKEKDVSNSTTIKSGKVYLITNLINNKKYVGITKGTLERRFKRHISQSNKPSDKKGIMVICLAIKKYGKKNFKIELIEELVNVTEKGLLLKESYYINKYNTFINDGCGYNMVKESDSKLIFSEATKKKISLARMGKWNGKDNPFYGKHHTENTREKMKINHANFKGNKHPKADLTIRKFKNIETNEEFQGNRHQFIEKYNLNKFSVKSLMWGRYKILHGWILC